MPQYGKAQDCFLLSFLLGFPPIKDASIPAGRFLKLIANSENLMKRILGWLDQCIHSQQRCQQCGKENLDNVLRKFPARVLDLRPLKSTSVNFPQLTKDFCNPYVALSHCCGNTCHIVTEINNIKYHKMGILLQHLPKTLQDAIVFTKSIGLYYLYIDFLYIIQDNITD